MILVVTSSPAQTPKKYSADCERFLSERAKGPVYRLGSASECVLIYIHCLTTKLMGLLQLRFEHDSATTRYEVFRALAYEIVYENQW